VGNETSFTGLENLYSRRIAINRVSPQSVRLRAPHWLARHNVTQRS
jgi:hypothetical protein